MRKYIIAITLFCLSLFLIDSAYALEGDYSSSNFQIFTYSSPDGGTRTSSGYSSGLNVSHNLNGGYLDGLYIQVFGSSSIVYEAGNTYTFDFRVNFNPKKWSYLDNTFTTSTMEAYGSTTASSSGMSMDNITSSSLSITNIDGNTYQMHYIFKVVPETDLKYIMFKCFYPYGLMGADLNYVYALSTVRVVDLTVTYQQGIGSVIDEQTIIIQNQTDKIVDTQKETNEKLDETNKQLEETNDFLTSDEEPNSDISALGNVQGLLPPGPVDSLLNIPFYFLSVVNSSMGGVCVPVSGNFVFDSTLTLPCFGDLFYNNVPDYLMNFLSLIPGAFILIKYFKHLYKKVNRAVSMESNADDEWGVL